MAIITKYNLNWIAEDYGNPKLLVLTDLSQYPETPDKPIWQITLPGFDTGIELAGLPGRSLYLDSNLLGFSLNAEACDLLDLPDGLWSICYRVCPYDELYHSGYFFKTSKLQRDFDVVLAGAEVDGNGEIKTCSLADFEAVMLMLESCKACARIGHNAKALQRYETALKLFNKLKLKCNG